MVRMKFTRLMLCAALLVVPLANSAWSQPRAFPQGPVKILVGYGPGGGNDISARIISEELSKMWGQPVVVENKPGANGAIASTQVARSAPDGLTLLVMPPTTMMIDAAWRPNTAIDPAKELTALAGLASTPLVYTVSASSPLNNVRDLIAAAKQTKAGLNYGWGNPGMRVSTQLFSDAVGIKMFAVGYKSAGQSVPALLAGDVQMLVIDAGPVVGLLKAGKAKALAVTTPARSATLPDVPTLREQGVDFDWTGFIALYGPANLPANVRTKIQNDVATVLKRPEIRNRFLTAGMDPSTMSPAELDSYLEGVGKRIRGVMSTPGFSLE